MDKSSFSERFEEEWIKKMNEWASPIADELNLPKKKYNDTYNKTEASRISKKKYYGSQKGKDACKRRTAIYNRRIRDLAKSLNEQEKESIKLFYVNCPQGYHVDHIIPISKGGLHHINNLQYLPAYENWSKGNRVFPERDKISYEYHKFRQNLFCQYCENEMIALSDETLYCEICKKAFGIALFET